MDTLNVRIESADFAADELLVRRFAGTEAISRLWSFEVELVSTSPDGLSADARPGAHVTIVIEREGQPDARRIHGIIASMRHRLDTLKNERGYVLRIAPDFHRLSLVETQEIFMDLSVPEIIKKKLELYDLAANLDLRLEGTYAAREFVVQYRESDVAFVSRLAEHLGVSFFFEHGDDHDKLVFTDHIEGFHRSDAALAYQGRGAAHDVYELELEELLIPAVYAVQDYNYRQPLTDLGGSVELEDHGEGGVVEYASHHKTPEEGAVLARVRSEEQLARSRVYEGKSDLFRLSAGLTDELEGHPLFSTLDLLFTEVTHDYRVAGDGKGTYANTFRAVSAKHDYRPERKTKRPRISGFVTGIIQPGPGGAIGGVAQLDEVGRYSVLFHFDTSPPNTQKTSKPVRMAQPFAGPNHGMHFPLRPGSEVLVAFLDGDPDRPIIIGSVPNAIAPSPVNVGNATKNRISTANGGIVIELGDHT